MKPTRSTKSTETTFRSSPAGAASSAVPQARQKRARSGFSSPQFGADDHRASVRTRHRDGTSPKDHGGYVREMDEARSVLERLERIEALERRGSPAELMLAELRELVAEAEAWVRVEPGPTERRRGRDRAPPAGGRRTLSARGGLC